MQNVNIIQEPILDVGSKDYGNTPDFRSRFTNYKYVGIDMEEGKGVDLIVGLSNDLNLVIKIWVERNPKP